jgi:hypothetical protein
MEDYTQYTLEGAASFFIIVLAYRLYRMRCNTSSNCCDGNVKADFHNGGGDVEI